jgi:hypothetical protein
MDEYILLLHHFIVEENYQYDKRSESLHNFTKFSKNMVTFGTKKK